MSKLPFVAVLLIALVLGLGIGAVMHGNVGLAVVCALAIVLIVRLVRHGEPTQDEIDAADAARIEFIRHKAESADALRNARQAFNNDASFRQVMPTIDGTEL